MVRGLYAVDEADAQLSLLPLAARRALDCAGRKLPLEGWTSLEGLHRRALVELGAGDDVDVAAVRELVAKATVPAEEIDAQADPNPARPPAPVVAALGEARPLDDDRWRAMTALDRWALAKVASRGKPARLFALYDEIVDRPRRPTHLDEKGEARMVSVTEKAVTARRAVASARVTMRPETVAAITTGGAAKGDVFGVARIAGIQAAKRTHELIPLCHSVALTQVDVTFEVGEGEVRIRATAWAVDRTGVEMEAMVAASVAALTVYDMVKGMDRWMIVEAVQLEEKEGGRSGRLVRAR